jgi:tetratricopeptide (TPR) repeat protein
VSAETAQLLRSAALLGSRFAVTDLALVLRRPVSDMVGSLQEAVTAGIVEGSGAELAFRHPLIRQALYESMPEAVRTALHAEAAHELMSAGADTLRVAQQLSAARGPGESWARAWLVQVAPALATRAPELAAELLRRELDETPAADDEARNTLAIGLAKALLAVGSYHEAAERASRALMMLTDPARRGETSWLLAHAQASAGRKDATAVIWQALAATDLPRIWQARLLALLGLLERDATGLEVGDSIAHRALAAAEESGDPSATVQAMATLWLTQSVRRDHATALDCIDRALRNHGRGSRL